MKQQTFGFLKGNWFKRNWRGVIFPACILCANLPSALMEGRQDYLFSVGIGVSAVLVFVWMYLMCLRKPTEFERYMIISAIVAAAKDLIDAVLYMHLTSSTPLEIILYVILVTIWLRYIYCVTKPPA